MLSHTNLTSLSPLSNKPCLLLNFPSCKILFDCAIDFYPMNYYNCSSVISRAELDLTDFPNENLHRRLHHHQHMRKKHLKDEKDSFTDVLPNGNLVDAMPEVSYHFVSNIDLSQIDAVFISNWESLKALPYLIDNPKFSCPVYSSEPVVSLGGMIIEEMIHYLERVDKNADDKEWVNIDTWDKAVGEDPKKLIPHQWKSFYSREVLNKALSLITKVAINQPVKVGNMVTVSLFPSGYDIGSCNWHISNGGKRIGYWAASSIQKGYMREMEVKHFEKLDCLIVTSLSKKTISPNTIIGDMCAMTVTTLQKGGNVLLPMDAIGPIYGIIENLIGEMDRRECCYPVYIISPVASRALAWTNISGEWFNSERRDWLFEPKMPFHLQEFIEKKRVFLYNSIHSDFSTQYATPCVVFTGHPSLRIGDAVFFTELWGQDSRSVVMLTNPDYDFEKVWLPFKHLFIKPLCYPIDMRLTINDVNTLLLRDVLPKKILISEEYTSFPGTLKHTNVMAYKFAQSSDLVSVHSSVNLSCFDGSIQKKFKTSGGIVQGYVNHLDTKFEFTTTSDLKTADPITLTKFRSSAADIGGMITADLPFRKRLKGELSGSKLKAAFEKEKYYMTRVHKPDGSTTYIIKSLSAEITLKQNRTLIKCSNVTNRRIVAGILDKLLKNLMSEK